MFEWEDREYINPRKKVFKNMDTNEILNLELQDDTDNILKESETPLNAHNLNLAQQELVDDMSKTYTGTNITAETVEGYGRINKVYGYTKEIGTGDKSPDNSYKLECVGDDVNLFDFDTSVNDQGVSGNNNVTYTILNKEIKVVNTGTYGRANFKITIDNSLVNKKLTLSFDAVSTHSGTFNQISLGKDNSIDTKTYGTVTVNTDIKRYSITFIPTSNILYMPVYVTTSHAVTGVTITIRNIESVNFFV